MLHYAEGESTRKERTRVVEWRADIEMAEARGAGEREEGVAKVRPGMGKGEMRETRLAEALARGSNKNDGIVLTSLL